jgi:hypothetical protein
MVTDTVEKVTDTRRIPSDFEGRVVKKSFSRNIIDVASVDFNGVAKNSEYIFMIIV